VSDIVIPPGVEVETDPGATVVAGQPPRVQVTAEEEAAQAALAAEVVGDSGVGAGGAAASAEPTEE
jgi:hypothetical protein